MSGRPRPSEPTPARIEALWIDLGGVVFRDPRPVVVRELCDHDRLDPGRLGPAYYRLSRALDRGAIDLRTTYERLRRAFSLWMSYREFRELVSDTSLAAITTVLPALRRLRASGKVRIVITSNVSRPVWGGLERRFRVSGAAHALALSFRLGTLKPRSGFFREALRLSGTGRNRVLFLDDSLRNVLAARRFGVRARRVTGARDTLHWLRSLAALGPDGRPSIPERRHRRRTPRNEGPRRTGRGRKRLRVATPSNRPGRSLR